MLALEIIEAQIQRQIAGIPDQQIIVVDADLRRCGGGVVAMRDGVDQSFAQRTERIFPNFLALRLAGDHQAYSQMALDKGKSAINLLGERAADFRIINDDSFAFETSGFDFRLWKKNLRRFAKEQDRGVGDLTVANQAQLVENRERRFALC